MIFVASATRISLIICCVEYIKVISPESSSLVNSATLNVTNHILFGQYYEHHQAPLWRFSDSSAIARRSQWDCMGADAPSGLENPEIRSVCDFRCCCYMHFALQMHYNVPFPDLEAEKFSAIPCRTYKCKPLSTPPPQRKPWLDPIRLCLVPCSNVTTC